MTNKSKRKHRRRPAGGNPFEHAPLQGMGETYEWLTNDVSPVQFDTSNGNGAYTLAVNCDVNGFSWNLQFAGANVNSSPVTGAPLTL